MDAGIARQKTIDKCGEPTPRLSVEDLFKVDVVNVEEVRF